MGHLMALGQDAIVPALAYLFHRVKERLDGRPTSMDLDEA
jgi:type IV secretion system protein VirB4